MTDPDENQPACPGEPAYSTVTHLARFRGLSMSDSGHRTVRSPRRVGSDPGRHSSDADGGDHDGPMICAAVGGLEQGALTLEARLLV